MHRIAKTSVCNIRPKMTPLGSCSNSRTFFWSSNDDNNNNNNNNNNNKDKDDVKKDSNKDTTNENKKNPSSFSSSSSSSSNDNSSKTNNSSSSNSSMSSSNSNSSVVPLRLGYGDEAPKYPHLMALPLISRPLFPGIITTIHLTDPTTIQALDAKLKKGGPSNSYISVFLRQQHSTGVLDDDDHDGSGMILEKPELITNTQELYNVGSFAQIHRITKGYGSSSSSSSSSSRDDHVGDVLYSTSHDDDDDLDNLTASILLLAHRRVDLLSIDSIGPPIDVTVSHWNRLLYKYGSDSTKDDTIKALTNEIFSTIRSIAQINSLFRETLSVFPTRVDANDPYKLADFAASLTTCGTPHDLQSIFEERDAELKLHQALVLLSKEKEVSELQQEISRKVEEKMSETQRKYMLMEQLKSIKKELGMEKDDKEALILKYRKLIAKYDKHVEDGSNTKTNKNKNHKSNNDNSSGIPKDVRLVIESELEKLSTLEKNSSEFNVTRSYLDWLTSIPWGIVSNENFDIGKARSILNRDHYGLEEVKDTILQFIAVGKLKGNVQGKILCLVGPPGVGKTSIAESVAAALGRKYYRLSVGGLSDVSEIKGHRRTYIGAMPGKIIQCLKSAGTVNPLVLIDEIDKLGGGGYRGDPAAALLEVLDPNQNSTFMDHFMDVPVDISKVLFMCTANDIGSIPGPLLDRMEVIRLSGYDVPEKIAIAEEYLVPKAMRDSGLIVDVEQGNTQANKEEEYVNHNNEMNVTDSTTLIQNNDIITPSSTPTVIRDALSLDRGAIEALVRWYCREAGVRNLNKYIEKITRKLALQIVAENEGTTLSEKSSRKTETWTVTQHNLEDYVGKPIFTSDRLYDKDPLPHGIVMGLAWTSMGGSALYIETQAIHRGVDKDGKKRGGGSLKVTGQLGDVMSESSQIAYTVSRAILSKVNPSSSYFDEIDIHMHVPEGATPKDGPSAGITMTTAMLSLALDKPIRNDLAMTGEISLTGRVLPVGGIKEKIMAARRAGIKCIILPSGNKRDFDEMPTYLKEGLEVHFADDYDTVYKVAFQ